MRWTSMLTLMSYLFNKMLAQEIEPPKNSSKAQFRLAPNHVYRKRLVFLRTLRQTQEFLESIKEEQTTQ